MEEARSKVIGLHILHPRSAEEYEELEEGILTSVIPQFKSVPGVLEVGMLKNLWGEQRLIGFMVIFKDQDALEVWWNGLPQEEKDQQFEAVEKYKDIFVVHNDFRIITEMEEKAK